jgi:hypothetical protein
LHSATEEAAEEKGECGERFEIRETNSKHLNFEKSFKKIKKDLRV